MPDLDGSLDANVILRLLLNDVPAQHDAALKLFNKTITQLSISDTAVIEVVFVLGRVYGFTRQQVFEAIGGLMKLQKLNLNRALFEMALSYFIKHPSLSFEDCCLVVYAQLNQAEPLWTFDKKLANQIPGAKIIAS
ncbi:MAG TPA: PIN domain-containing protein [Candidatus Binatia bacterium]|nr:PIN domain-containing protein [Candidatus Binatia bacterium]